MLLDAGNTRLKWARVRLLSGSTARPEPQWLADGAVPYDEIAALFHAWDQIPVAEYALGANVAGNARVLDIEQYWRQRGLVIEWAQSQTAACGVRNQYQQAAQLGVDRWAAMLGAWHRMHQVCVVVSAGTAMTVDSLDAQGVFQGGLILPGKQLMHNALTSATHALTTRHGAVVDYPRNTADAMASGIAAAMAGAVREASARLAMSHGRAPQCLLTGGDAAWLASHLPIGCTIAPRLVLEGLLEMLLEGTRK